MGWPTAIAIGASTIGSIAAGKSQAAASGKAAKYQYGSSIAAIEALKKSEAATRKGFAPYAAMGERAIPGLEGVDPTGGAGYYAGQLEALGTDFQYDPNNPAYQFQKAEIEKSINQSLASRGLYNSRMGVNALSEANARLVAQETEKQYARKYGRLTDLFDMSRMLGGSQYGKQLDLTNIGMGAAAGTGMASTATGQGISQAYGTLGKGLAGTALATGQAQSNLYSGLGNVPLNYLMMQQLMGGGQTAPVQWAPYQGVGR